MFLLFSYILSYRFFIESYCTDITFDAHPHSGWFICLERFAFSTGLISPTKLSPAGRFQPPGSFVFVYVSRAVISFEQSSSQNNCCKPYSYRLCGMHGFDIRTLFREPLSYRHNF